MNLKSEKTKQEQKTAGTANEQIADLLLTKSNAEQVKGSAATGRRQYRPIVIRKDIDKSSPVMEDGE